MGYSTADLLKIIKKRCFIPLSQETLTAEDILDIASEELRDIVYPKVKQAREEFYVTFEDVNALSGTNTYPIPARATAMSLREVKYLMGDSERNLALKSLEEKGEFGNVGGLSGCYVIGDDIELMGQSGTTTLRMYYIQRPGALVETNKAATIASVDTATNIITVDSVPSDWAVSTKLDIIKADPGFTTKSTDLVISEIDGVNVTVTGTISSRVATDDWLTPADTSPVPQIPPELFSYLAQATVMQIYESLGDFEAKAAAEKKFDKIEKGILSLIAPRISGEGKKVLGRLSSSNIWGFNSWLKKS